MKQVIQQLTETLGQKKLSLVMLESCRDNPDFETQFPDVAKNLESNIKDLKKLITEFLDAIDVLSGSEDILEGKTRSGLVLKSKPFDPKIIN